MLDQSFTGTNESLYDIDNYNVSYGKKYEQDLEYYYQSEPIAKTPVERLLALKYKKAEPVEMVQGLQTRHGTKFNQLKTNHLSPTRRSIDESSLLKTFNYVNGARAAIYDEITKNQDDFFDALSEVVRAKRFPPGSVLPKITSPKRNHSNEHNSHRMEPQQSPISMVVRKSINRFNKSNNIFKNTNRKKNRRTSSNRKKKKKENSMKGKSKSMQTLDDNRIYSNPFHHARLLQKAMERRRKKEEQKFMKELEYLQQHILNEEKRRSQRLKDTRSAYSNANKFYKHERKYLQNVSQERRLNDAEEAVKKVQYEKESMEKRREEAQRDKEDMQMKKAKLMKEEWEKRKRARKEREKFERLQREQVEKEKRREWQLMQQSEQRKEHRQRREREAKEKQMREDRRNEKYAQSMI